MLYFVVTTLEVRGRRDSYDVLLGFGLLREIGRIVSKRMARGRCAIITDENVGALFGPNVCAALSQAAIQPLVVTLPVGEQSKNLQQVSSICERMATAGLDRTSFVVGLGGGVVGDISGFVAAIYHRGIAHIQIPTTLLAMVDSSIGGKTGVNTTTGKNVVGAVHPPAIIIDDLEVLRTLPPRDVKQGFAEIIKHGIIADRAMFEQLRSSVDPVQLFNSESSAVEELVRRNIEIKSRIVEEDELDRTGSRAVLNFGHTIGHAIERAGDYARFAHGEAISLGMVAAAAISVRRAGLAESARTVIVEVLTRFGLPIQLPDDASQAAILEAVKLDKKFEGGEIRFVVTPAIGTAYVSDGVTWEDIRGAIAELQTARSL